MRRSRLTPTSQITIAAVLLWLLAIAGISQANAAQLTVNTMSPGAILSISRCASASLESTVAGAASGGDYTAVEISGIPAGCQAGQSAEIFVHDVGGTVLTTGTVTLNAGTVDVLTGAYAPDDVEDVIVRINGWVFPTNWTAPVEPTDAMIRCYQVNPGGQQQVEFPCNPTINPNGGAPWNYDGGTQLWGFYFSVEGPTELEWKNGAWKVEFDFSQSPPYPGFTPNFVGSTSTPGVFETASNSCTDLPIFRLNSTDLSGGTYGLQIEIGDGAAPSWYTPDRIFCE